MKQHVLWALDPEELGRAIKRVRIERGLTQAELAQRLGVVRMTISRLEQGDGVSMETALRAITECGYGVALAPKFSRLIIEDDASDPRITNFEGSRQFDG